MEERIIIPIGSFYPAQLGGPSNTMYWHSKQLAYSGISVTVITTNRGIEGAYDDDIWQEVDGIKVIYCKNAFTFFLILFLEIRDSSIVHLNSLFYWRSLVSYLIARGFKKTIFWSIRGELHKAAMSRKNILKRFVLIALTKIVKGVRFHGTSEEEINLIQSYFPKNIGIKLPNYIALNRKEIRMNKMRQILFLGRIDPIKNLTFLIEIFRKCHFDSDVQLVIAGKLDSSYAEEVSNKIETEQIPNIRLVGEVKGDNKRRLLEDSALLMLPSLSENFGNVVVEALSYGTPVMSSVNTPWEDLETFQCGYHLHLIEEKWIKCLEKHMNSLDTDVITNMSLRAFDYCREHFDVKTGIFNWIEIYEKSVIK